MADESEETKVAVDFKAGSNITVWPGEAYSDWAARCGYLPDAGALKHISDKDGKELAALFRLHGGTGKK